MNRTYARAATAVGASLLVALPTAATTTPASAGVLPPAPSAKLTTPAPTGKSPVTSPVTSPVRSTSLGTSLSALLQQASSHFAGGFISQGWRYGDGVTTLAQIRSSIGAEGVASRYDGTGIGIALVDTGVVPTTGLTSGNVVNGPDLSFESQDPGLAHLDTFGHGTHMAGIIAGNDKSTQLKGVAPGARLTSLKLSGSDGQVDVSQVIAALDWVVQHRADDAKRPIRVINLSFGTDGVQASQVDPLALAVENAWRAGIVVVVSGGNGGGVLDNPARDPFVLSVGAADTVGTTYPGDDTVPTFSARGDKTRRVDLVAPGTSVASLRDPGSALDTAFPDAVYNTAFFKGSGTSQAAAVVSGAVALLLQARPTLTPDQVKAVLTQSATPLSLADVTGRGAGEVNVSNALSRLVGTSTQTSTRSKGTGSLEASRGSAHVSDGDTELTGENTILGPFDSVSWAAASTAGKAWNGGAWMGQQWTGGCACETTWSGPTWSTVPWTGRSWSGRSWSGRSWSGRSWSGRSWSGASWPSS